MPGLVAFCRPETRGVRSQNLVDKVQGSINDAEFQLCVGHDDAAGGSVVASLLVDGQGLFLDILGNVLAKECTGAVYRDVLVVLSELGLGGRSEDGLFQLVGFLQTLGKLVTADGAVILVGFPAGAGNVAAHNAFHGQGTGPAHQDCAAFELVCPGLQFLGEFVHIAFNDVVRHDVLEHVHPEQCDLVQDNTLVGNGSGHHDVEGAHAVCGHNEQGLVVNGVDVAHLAAGQERKSVYARTGNYFHKTPRLGCSCLCAWALRGLGPDNRQGMERRAL